MSLLVIIVLILEFNIIVNIYWFLKLWSRRQKQDYESKANLFRRNFYFLSTISQSLVEEVIVVPLRYMPRTLYYELKTII